MKKRTSLSKKLFFSLNPLASYKQMSSISGLCHSFYFLRQHCCCCYFCCCCCCCSYVQMFYLFRSSSFSLGQGLKFVLLFLLLLIVLLFKPKVFVIIVIADVIKSLNIFFLKVSRF